MNRKTQTSIRENILRAAAEKYRAEPEYLWMNDPDAAVLRHTENRKWFALLMRLPRRTLGLSGEEKVDILNVKCDTLLVELLLQEPGFLPAYHMNKRSWITILLDGTVAFERILSLLEESYRATAAQRTKKQMRAPGKAWLLPANPKIFDLDAAFAASDTLLWKQKDSVLVGDYLFIYMAAPVCAVLYYCRVEEMNLRPSPEDSDGTICMKIHLLRRFQPEELPLRVMRECGVYSVRNLRSVPPSLQVVLDALLQ